MIDSETRRIATAKAAWSEFWQETKRIMDEIERDKDIDPRTLRAARKHGVTIHLGTEGFLVGCWKCGQQWRPMLQTGGKLPRQWWKCPRGWECN